MRDLRQCERRTQLGIALGLLALLFGFGGLLIYLFYGAGAALLGLSCLAVALAPVALIALGLWGFGWIAGRSHPKLMDDDLRRRSL